MVEPRVQQGPGPQGPRSGQVAARPQREVRGPSLERRGPPLPATIAAILLSLLPVTGLGWRGPPACYVRFPLYNFGRNEAGKQLRPRMWSEKPALSQSFRKSG